MTIFRTTYIHTKIMTTNPKAVDVTDLLLAIANRDGEKVVDWLCLVRDNDAHAHNGVTRAADAVLSTLVRMFCARYITKSLNHIEHFANLITAAYDLSIDSYRRWQRIANVACYLLHNPRKPSTVHVYPCLASPLPELDEIEPHRMQKRITQARLAKIYSTYLKDLLPDTVVADCVRSWLHGEGGEKLSHPEREWELCSIEALLAKRDSKNAFRVCTYLFAACPELRSTNLTDAFECAWKVLLMAVDVLCPSSADVQYIRCCRELFFKALPPKRLARVARMAFLYYAIVVACHGTRSVGDSVTFAALNLPVTIPREMGYLTLFPRLP